jgi:hypothetical protein
MFNRNGVRWRVRQKIAHGYDDEKASAPISVFTDVSRRKSKAKAAILMKMYQDRHLEGTIRQ